MRFRNPFSVIIGQLRGIAFVCDQILAQFETAEHSAKATLGMTVAIHPKPGTKGVVTLKALAFNDKEFAEGTLVPAVVDADGKPFVDDNGDPVDLKPEDLTISYASSSTAVVDPSGSAGQNFNFQSGNTGRAQVTVSIAGYPGGKTKEFVFDCIVGNSEPGDPEVAVEIKPEA